MRGLDEQLTDRNRGFEKSPYRNHAAEFVITDCGKSHRCDAAALRAVRLAADLQGVISVRRSAETVCVVFAKSLVRIVWRLQELL